MSLSSADGRQRAIEVAASRYYERMTGGTRSWNERLSETEPDKDRSRQLAAQILDDAYNAGAIQWETWE